MDDIGLQRAIYASLQTANNAPRPSAVRASSFTRQSNNAPATRLPPRTRDIMPTAPRRAAPAPRNAGSGPARRNVCEKEGILPATPSPLIERGQPRASAAPAASAAVDSREAPKERKPPVPRTRSASDASNSYISSGADPPISKRSEHIPGWREVVSGGKAVRQNPAGTHVIISTDEVHRAGGEVFDDQHVVALLSDKASVLGKGLTYSTTVKCLTRDYYVMAVMAFGVQYDAATGNFSCFGFTVHFDANGYVYGSLDKYDYSKDNHRLNVLEPLQRAVPLAQASRGDSINVSVSLGVCQASVTVNDAFVFKNVSVPGVDPRVPTHAIGFLVTGGRLSVKNITLAEGEAGPPPPNIDKDFAAIIEADIMERSPNVQWEDIAALGEAKRLLNEAVVLPLLIPEFFTGIRAPWKGVLLFGPPGTGKTMLAKAVATCAKTTFFNVSAATLVSKWHGESEKLVKCLFQLAHHHAPSTVFFDEIDALMMKRGEGAEAEASRRLKSEMLSQIDGMGTCGDSRVMVLATTNKPWDLDDAMRRRLEKRIYIPLPELDGREEIFKICTKTITLAPDVSLRNLAQRTEGYSGADVYQLCRDAAMMPMRRVIADKSPQQIAEMKERGMLASAPVTSADFDVAISKIQPSVGQNELKRYVSWFAEFGST